MSVSISHLRIARPVSDLQRAVAMYRDGLGLEVLGGFEDHAGFDGVMLGDPARHWHLEFTHCRRQKVEPRHTVEDLLVIYVDGLEAFEAFCLRLTGSGFERVAPFNPYWRENGATFADGDGYRVVVSRVAWLALFSSTRDAAASAAQPHR
ncbi:VOC family protein [Pseudomonas sp. K1(2024)]|uniref:VOC family protein n=1 Tax=Pseudomonas boreofloridensis TaxID=3064348 RepID=A0ABV4ZDN8_9PSED|nr:MULTISPECIES: VOC family protein [unclassified Pseudomonas]MDO7903274.1 VOC family protein [Pseudomonas sp. K13]MDV9033431.1 VOC family protein [Pseudomonas sp. RAC1]